MIVKYCIHCKYRLANQRRGLCNACYIVPEIKERYPRLDTRETRIANGKKAWGAGKNRPLGQPTRAEPGTEEKIRIMELRDELGLAVFHPDDTHYDPRIGDMVHPHGVETCTPLSLTLALSLLKGGKSSTERGSIA